jgi:hypothetical protein
LWQPNGLENRRSRAHILGMPIFREFDYLQAAGIAITILSVLMCIALWYL